MFIRILFSLVLFLCFYVGRNSSFRILLLFWSIFTLLPVYLVCIVSFQYDNYTFSQSEILTLNFIIITLGVNDVGDKRVFVCLFSKFSQRKCKDLDLVTIKLLQQVFSLLSA